MGRRTVLLVAAILIAALGAGLVLLYVHNVNQRVSAREAPRQILVAKKIIPAGTTGAAAFASGDLEFIQLPAAAIAPNALASISKVADLVTLAPIYPGRADPEHEVRQGRRLGRADDPDRGHDGHQRVAAWPSPGQRIHRAGLAGSGVS